MNRLTVFVTCLFSLTPLLASNHLLSLPVVSVGSNTLSKSDLELVVKELKISLGHPLDLGPINSGIKDLYYKGQFLRLFVEAEPEGSAIKVIVNGEKQRHVSSLKFSNLDPDIIDELKTKINWEENKDLDIHALEDIRAKLKAIYEARGYYSANVEFQFNSDKGSKEQEAIIEVHPNAPAIISSIKISNLSTFEQREVLASLPLKKSAIFTKDLLGKSVSYVNKYLKANQYPTSKVDSTSLNFNELKTTVDLTISVKMGGRFQFQFSGNRVLSDYELRAFLNDEALSQVDFANRVAESIEKRYQSYGFYFCKVWPRTLVREHEKLNIIRFEIEEGPRVRMDGLYFIGNLGSIGERGFRSLFFEVAPGVLKRGLYWEIGIDDAVQKMRTRALSLGYLNASIQSPRRVFTQDSKGVELYFNVECGTKTLFSGIESFGNHYLTKEEINDAIGVRVGDPFNQALVDAGKDKVLTLYHNKGFLDATLEITRGSVVSDSRDVQGTVIQLKIEEGRQYHVGTIVIEGNNRTKSEVILRELRIKEAEPYDPSKVQESEENVSTLGIFSRVEILSRDDTNEKGKKNLTVVVREAKPGLGELGFGGFYEDPLLRMRTFVGLMYRNLSGLNRTVSARTELSVPFSRYNPLIPFIEYSGIVGFRSPYPLSLPLTFNSNFIFDSYQVSSIDSHFTLQSRSKFETRLEKKFLKHLNMIYHFYQLERTRTETIGVTGSERVELIGSTGPELILDLRDDIYNPTYGSLHNLQLEFASPILLSNSGISFVMVHWRNSIYVPLVFNLGLQLYAGFGYAHSLFGGHSIPTARLTNDLSLGGRASIRGFSPNRFSPIPVGYSGPPIEDTAYWNGRVEIGIPIFSSFSAATFFDSGQIYPNLKPGTRHDGVGIGIRYKTPVGPVAVDFAQGLGADKEIVKFYFTVGTL